MEGHSAHRLFRLESGSELRMHSEMPIVLVSSREALHGVDDVARRDAELLEQLVRTAAAWNLA